MDAEKDVVVRLDPHPDRDYDEVRDSLDVYPDNHLLWSDQDGDGFADQPGTPTSDDCPQAGGTSTIGLRGCPDSDDDGRADLSDDYPEDETQWADTDGDGYGDNPSGIDPDSCPYTTGYSEYDRKGCPDTDEDGYSDPSLDWTSNDGADAFPSHDSQWSDSDSDGYGDNPAPAYLPDDCPQSSGSSTEDRRGAQTATETDGRTTATRLRATRRSGVTPTLMAMATTHPLPRHPTPAHRWLGTRQSGRWDAQMVTAMGGPTKDSHPDSNLMWSDSDGDGFSDQQGAPLSDDCPDQWGKSDQTDRCPDGDGMAGPTGGSLGPQPSFRSRYTSGLGQSWL